MGIQPYHQKVYNDLLKEFETIKRREEVKNQLFDKWKTDMIDPIKAKYPKPS